MAILMDVLFEVIGYSIGRLLLPLMSLGRAHAEPLLVAVKKFNWFGYRRDESG
ncbi:hypothetical protein ES703_76058 [subsurface metagenome]